MLHMQHVPRRAKLPGSSVSARSLTMIIYGDIRDKESRQKKAGMVMKLVICLAYGHEHILLL